MENLVSDLRKCKNPYNCPHGRPTIIFYSNYDLEKLSNTTTLKGLFVKKMLEKSQNKNISKDEKNIIEKAIEIGLEALE